MGHMGGLINPRPGRGQYRAGFSNTGGSPKPRKEGAVSKKGNKASNTENNIAGTLMNVSMHA